MTGHRRGSIPSGTHQRAQARGRPSRTKKRRHSRVRIVAWTTAGVLGLTATAGGVVYWRLNGNITTFDGDAVSTDRPDAARPDAQGRTPANVLLIGSDSRGGGNSDLGGGNEGGARSDTTILLHIYADHKHATGISIPRDSLVDIPPCKLPSGKWTKPQSNVMINSAFAVGDTEEGNPACTQNAVEKLTGLRIDHTIVVNFAGFAEMTGAIGGVDICMPKDVYEGDLNPNLGRKGKLLFPKGRQKVSGQAALDYVRIRHGLGDGSDIGRTKRQQAFMSALIKEVKSRGMNPTALLPLADAATRSLTVDPGLGSAQKLLSFALSLKDIDLHDMKFLTVPWRYEGPRVALVKPDVDQLWAALKADRTIDGQDAGVSTASAAAEPSAPPAPPAETPAGAAPDGTGVKVGVYNGTTATGLAAKAATTLKAAKYTVTTTGTAAARDRTGTLVRYGPGEKAKAQQVATLFPGATLEASSRAGISLVLGKDYAAVNGGSAETTTPASPATPAPLPTSATQDARSADDDPCANLSYG
ncbi:LCP family protein [Kitasatospora misakiensis]|uniref:LCP family protein n=1 Tax=Kitasatospora misakiensis TaxID=67330 RepID=A0ABW0XCC3_9ACTN